MTKIFQNGSIKAYAMFQIFREPLFWGPILILYITNIGRMSLSEIYFMEAVAVLVQIVAEVYSGAWADLLGRKKMMVLGSFLNLISLILFLFVNSPLLVWISNIFIMIGCSIVSGADEAFLFNYLDKKGKSNLYTRVMGRILSYRFILLAISCILAGYLYKINPRLPILLSIPGSILSFIAVLFIQEDGREVESVTHREHFLLTKSSFSFIWRNKVVRWVVVYIVFVLAASKLWFFTLNPYFEKVDIPFEYFGWIFFFLNILAWFSSRFAYVVEERFKESYIIFGMILSLGLPIILMGIFVSQFSLLLLVFDSLLRGFREPFFSSLLNKYLNEKTRATVLSIKSSLRSLVSAVFLWIFGIVLAVESLEVSLQIMGGMVLFLGVLVFWWYLVVFEENK